MFDAEGDEEKAVDDWSAILVCTHFFMLFLFFSLSFCFLFLLETFWRI